jgi:hypothetical protein
MLKPDSMMTSSNLYSAVLRCHPETYTQVVRGIEARVCWSHDAVLALTYALRADLMHLRLPAPRPPRRADRLWEHTCFESFVSVKGESGYYEFNFAPSGEWAAYAFHSYRAGAPLVDEELAPCINVGREGDSLHFEATLRLDRLPTIRAGVVLRLALSAVIEDDRGVLSYWALKHPPGKPDFHHPDAFTLEIEPSQLQVKSQPAMEKR